MRRFLQRLVNVLRPGRAEEELARETAAHLALLEEEYQCRGMTADDAHFAAKRAFGGVGQAKDRHRDARSFVWLDDARRDLRYAARMLSRSPGFTSVVVLTLALGIGANTAIFSVVHSVLLKPLPFRDSDQLVRLYENVPASVMTNGRPRRIGGMNMREMLELRARSHALSHVIGYAIVMLTATGRDGAVKLWGAPVSASTFSMLGVQPRFGRWFTPSEERTGAGRVIVLGDDAWRRCFGADPNVLGQTVTFTGRAGGMLGGNLPLGTSYTVVGVMPPDFHFPDATAQFWVPLVFTPPADGRPRRTPAGMMARLADGVSIDAAVAEVTTILQDLRQGTPSSGAGSGPAPASPRFELVRVKDELAAPVRPALAILTVAVGFVLLIACANVANLLLARAAARRREIAIRLAIGAGRGRLIRQALTESVLLALLGGAAGTALAFGGVGLFRVLVTSLARLDLGPSGGFFPRVDEIGIDATVFAFIAAVSMATGLLVGLPPALHHSRAHHVDLLRDGPASASGSVGVRRAHTAQHLLVIAETALATLLFVAGGLLIHSFVNLAGVDPGFQPSHVLTFQVPLPGERYPAARLRPVAEDLVARLRTVPGVTAAAYANQLPMVALRDTAGGLWRTPDAARPPSPDGADARLVSRDYFAAIGIRVIAGRGFVDTDGAGQPRVLVINEALAHGEFADENPLGKMVYIGRDPIPWQVVGIVVDVRQLGLDRAPQPQFFADLRQWPGASMPVFPVGAYYALRTAADPASVVANVRSVVRRFDADAVVDNVATMDQIVSNSMTLPRMYAVLLGIFAVVAVALAAIGIYGVMAYSVVQRRREIGIRMALGAQRGQVLRLVLRQSSALTIAGLTLGLAGAAAMTRYLEGLLFGLTPLDASTFLAVSILFGAIATLASYVPARRATTVDPSIALRTE